MFTTIDAIVSNALSGVTTLTAWSTGTVITAILGVWFLVIVIGLIYSVVTAVKRFQKSSKGR